MGIIQLRKKNSPAVLVYYIDFAHGITYMNLEERGAYFTLWLAQADKGHLSKDIIDRLVGNVWSTSSELRAKFIQDTAGLYYNERLDHELEKRKKYCANREKDPVTGKWINRKPIPEPETVPKTETVFRDGNISSSSLNSSDSKEAKESGARHRLKPDVKAAFLEIVRTETGKEANGYTWSLNREHLKEVDKIYTGEDLWELYQCGRKLNQNLEGKYSYNLVKMENYLKPTFLSDVKPLIEILRRKNGKL